MRWSRNGLYKKDIYFFSYGDQNQRSVACKQRKYNEAFKARALRLASESRGTQAAVAQVCIIPKLLYRWQQAQVVADVGSVEMARDPEVRALRAANKRLA
jgi:transposase